VLRLGRRPCRALAIVAGGLAAGVSPLLAQRAHQLEVGAFGSYNSFDGAYHLKDHIGEGARVGFFLLGHTLGLELDGGYVHPVADSGTGSAQVYTGSASLVFNFVAGHSSVYVLGGYTRLNFRGNSQFTDAAFHVGYGDRILLGDRLALRLEARNIFTPTSKLPVSSPPKWAMHIQGTAGVSVLLFGHFGPPPDADSDGVADKHDACPATPRGATVDERGCPHDADGDGVYDGIDKCPSTPAGAKVDVAGCPTDADKDGVFDGLDRCPNTPLGVKVDVAGCPVDSDKDGVTDDLDKCPNTPVGAKVDATGCPIDTDKDGVPDGIDQCVATPFGATVDATGCPLDSDKDGVYDGLDQCPNTPAGTQVDPRGCPANLDTDKDGVLDSVDKCPNTPPGTSVDATGCPILFTTKRTALVLRGVNFEVGRSALTADSYGVLDGVAASLVANPEIRIEIAGYTDNTGSAAVNTRLSQARAAAVRAYLAAKGVSPDRMVARGYGPTHPLAPNTTAAGRARNRRVELHQLP